MRAAGMSVFDWVVMDVVEMAFEVVFVFQRVFPVLRLPDTTPAVTFSAGCLRLFGTAE